MKPRHLIGLILITVIFLFYPGLEPMYTIVAQYPAAFAPEQPLPELPHKTAPVVRADAYELSLTADGVYVVELDSFTPLYEKNEHKKLYPASTVKMLTALTALEYHRPDTVISAKVATDQAYLMELYDGERITIEKLLYAIFLQSANDAAYALAHSTGDFPAFMQEMNRLAQRIGMRDSFFTNPAGLDEQNQLSTPYDMSLAAREVAEKDYLRKITATKEITVLDENLLKAHTLTNVNTLLSEVPGVGGLKTGYTELAGENLVTYYKNPDDGHTYLIVVMKSEDRFGETKAIIEWIRANVEYLPL